MRSGGTGGGLTKTGLDFERKVDFLSALSKLPGYSVVKHPGRSEILFQGRAVAECFKKHDFYKFLARVGVTDWRSIISKQLLPDDALYVPHAKTIFVVEIKWQQTEGSVDEKLQTCDFKRRQYERLLLGSGVGVRYVYVLSDWFKKPVYSDVLSYIESVGCFYFFDSLPVDFLSLPTPD